MQASRDTSGARQPVPKQYHGTTSASKSGSSLPSLGLLIGPSASRGILVKLLGIIFIIAASTAVFVSAGTWLLLGGAALGALAAMCVAAATLALGRRHIASVLREE